MGCKCEVCMSNDSLDKRLRSSALIEEGESRVLIDCGPDFRQQIMNFDFKPLDAVLLTHYHFDHVAGIDDIRPFCVFGPVNIYADKNSESSSRHHTVLLYRKPISECAATQLAGNHSTCNAASGRHHHHSVRRHAWEVADHGLPYGKVGIHHRHEDHRTT